MLFFVCRLLYRQFLSVDWAETRFEWAFLALACLSALVAKVLLAASYRGLLKAFGAELPWLQMMTVAWLPLAGKYIPGKVASLAGAILLFRRSGVSSSLAVSVVFMLNGLLVLVGLIVAVPLTLWQPIRAALPLTWLWCALLVGGGVICLHPKVFGRIGNFLLAKLKHQQFPRLPKLHDYAAPVAVMLVQCVMNGVAMWALARSITEISPIWIPFFISAAALASTLGFLAIFAPGGLGVREGILSLLLEPVVSAAGTAIVVVAFRIVHVLVDVVLILTAWRLLKSHPALGANDSITGGQEESNDGHVTPPSGISPTRAGPGGA